MEHHPDVATDSVPAVRGGREMSARWWLEVGGLVFLVVGTAVSLVWAALQLIGVL